MCYPRLPVDPGLLTRVGVGTSKSSSLVLQVYPFSCLCLSLNVLCNPRRKKRRVRDGGSRQIMVGQSYTLVVVGYSLLILVDA